MGEIEQCSFCAFGEEGGGGEFIVALKGESFLKRFGLGVLQHDLDIAFEVGSKGGVGEETTEDLGDVGLFASFDFEHEVEGMELIMAIF